MKSGKKTIEYEAEFNLQEAALIDYIAIGEKIKASIIEGLDKLKSLVEG